MGPIFAAPDVKPEGPKQREDRDDAKSEASYDPLFDEPDEQDADGEAPKPLTAQKSLATGSKILSNPRGPPTLDSNAYSMFSQDVLMTASVDGAVVLWDRRVNTPGKGVGRLEMSNKTPPWCVSVRVALRQVHCSSLRRSPNAYLLRRRAGPQTAGKFTRVDVIAPSTSGIRDNLGAR